MKAENCDRHGCTIGTKRVRYSDLRKYVCEECGGAVAHKFVWDEDTETSVDSVVCGRCGSPEIVSEYRFLEQISEGWEVERGLPEALRARMKGTETCQSAIEAAADLFD